MLARTLRIAETAMQTGDRSAEAFAAHVVAVAFVHIPSVADSALAALSHTHELLGSDSLCADAIDGMLSIYLFGCLFYYLVAYLFAIYLFILFMYFLIVHISFYFLLMHAVLTRTEICLLRNIRHSDHILSKQLVLQRNSIVFCRYVLLCLASTCELSIV